MAPFEMPYLLLLYLTPVYFCKLKVIEELQFSDQVHFLKAVEGEESCKTVETGYFTQGLRRFIHTSVASAFPLTAGRTGPSVPPKGLSRGAATCALAERPAPGPKHLCPATGGSFFNQEI